MSQHDYDLANAAGSTFRADLNNALAAIVSNNSGATAPATTFAYQWWADTTTGLLKQRNAANTAWITIGTLASTNLGLAALAGANSFTATQKWAKGADVASANALTLGADGNYFDITGTTAITSIGTVGVGAVVKLHFDGALTLTHHATDLILPGAANITTAAGDEAEFVEYASGDWRCTNYSAASGRAVAGSVIQQVNTQTGAVNTGTTVIPLDDTVPQNTEGNEYMTLAITPTKSTSILEITAVVIMSTSAAGANAMIAALFQDATAGALAASIQYVPAASAPATVVLKHRMTAGTTSATTFKIRGGCNSAGTTTFNGYAGARAFGGVMASSITITELPA